MQHPLLNRMEGLPRPSSTCNNLFTSLARGRNRAPRDVPPNCDGSNVWRGPAGNSCSDPRAGRTLLLERNILPSPHESLDLPRRNANPEWSALHLQFGQPKKNLRQGELAPANRVSSLLAPKQETTPGMAATLASESPMVALADLVQQACHELILPQTDAP